MANGKLQAELDVLAEAQEAVVGAMATLNNVRIFKGQAVTNVALLVVIEQANEAIDHLAEVVGMLVRGIKLDPDTLKQ